MIKKFTLSRTQKVPATRMLRAITGLGAFFLLLAIFISGCKRDDFENELVGVCPIVVSDPMDKAVDVVLDKLITITFNTDMMATSINSGTFFIKQAGVLVPGTVAATANPKVYTFKPSTPLLPLTAYVGTVTTGVMDLFSTATVADYIFAFTTIPQVTVTANPVLGGVVSGGGTFANSSVVTVNAVPSAGFAFTNWTEGTTVVSTSSSYQFTIAANRNLVANFTAIPLGSFSVALSANPVAGGVNTGSGAYTVGTVVTVSSVANNGFTFVNWTENGVVVSTSSSFQFVIAANRTLVANYRAIPASQFAVVLSSSPVAGGSTDGEGAYTAGTSVTISAVANTSYTFANWTDKVTGLVVSTSPNYTFALAGNRTFVANFLMKTYTLTTLATNGTVTRSPDQTTYNEGTLVTLTAIPAAGFTFTSWSGDATSTVTPLTVVMNASKTIRANFTAIPVVVVPAIGPGVVNLGGAADFVSLAKAAISTTGTTSITGNIGVSPAAATAMTGFGLIMDTDGTTSHTPIVTGKVYAANYAAPTPAKMTQAVADMETAYTTAQGLTVPAPIVGLYAGDLSGRILAPGLYKWATGVLISNQGVTLSGGANDTWVFQIAQNLTLQNSAKITLLGGAQAKNIVWVVAGQATLGTNADFSGVLMSKTLVSMESGAKVTGRLLAQTSVTLISNTLVQP